LRQGVHACLCVDKKPRNAGLFYVYSFRHSSMLLAGICYWFFFINFQSFQPCRFSHRRASSFSLLARKKTNQKKRTPLTSLHLKNKWRCPHHSLKTGLLRTNSLCNLNAPLSVRQQSRHPRRKLPVFNSLFGFLKWGVTSKANNWLGFCFLVPSQHLPHIVSTKGKFAMDGELSFLEHGSEWKRPGGEVLNWSFNLNVRDCHYNVWVPAGQMVPGRLFWVLF